MGRLVARDGLLERRRRARGGVIEAESAQDVVERERRRVSQASAGSAPSASPPSSVVPEAGGFRILRALGRGHRRSPDMWVDVEASAEALPVTMGSGGSPRPRAKRLWSTGRGRSERRRCGRRGHAPCAAPTRARRRGRRGGRACRISCSRGGCGGARLPGGRAGPRSRGSRGGPSVSGHERPAACFTRASMCAGSSMARRRSQQRTCSAMTASSATTRTRDVVGSHEDAPSDEACAGRSRLLVSRRTRASCETMTGTTRSVSGMRSGSWRQARRARRGGDRRGAREWWRGGADWRPRRASCAPACEGRRGTRRSGRRRRSGGCT